MGRVVQWLLILAGVAGLLVDAWVHIDLDHLYSFPRPGWVNEGVLFQIEGLLAMGAAVWLVLERDVWSAGFAAVLAGGGAFLLVLYRYVDVGRIGPIPNMHEPIWFAEKVVCLIGELVAFVATGALTIRYAYERRAHRRSRSADRSLVTLPG